MGLFGADGLTGDEHVARDALPNGTNQAMDCAAAGDDPESDLWQSQPRPARGDPDVAGQRQLHPAAEARTVDRRDRRVASRLEE